VAELLADTLPTGSQVVVQWVDARGRERSAEANASPGLLSQARKQLAGPNALTTQHEIHEGWIDEDGTRIAIAAVMSDTLPTASLRAWRALARKTVAATLANLSAQARIESLEKSERLQQALYEISDVAGAGLDTPILLRRIHAVVGNLMYAENFYIVAYNEQRETIRYLYFADCLDPYVAEPEREIPIGELAHSLTVGLLRYGQPVMGPSIVVGQKLGVAKDLEQGPDSQAWLGVPMSRDLQISGVIVVQSYEGSARYSAEDQTLLVYVAQHIQTRSIAGTRRSNWSVGSPSAPVNCERPMKNCRRKSSKRSARNDCNARCSVWAASSAEAISSAIRHPPGFVADGILRAFSAS